MHTDLGGLSISLTSPEAVVAWDRMQMRFLAHGADTADHLADVLTRAPTFAMAHAVKGLFMLLLGRRETVAMAHDSLNAAREALKANDATPRERLYVAALEEWTRGRPSVAADLFDHCVREAPGDALSVKIAQAIRFMLGDIDGMYRSVHAALPGFGSDHPGCGYMLGCQAFALEETGAFAVAERIGRRGLAMAPDDAWGLHAVAHVHDMTARARDGLKWLEGREAAWTHCNNFRYHVWWHKALMHLDLGQADAALALYDRSIRADRTDDYRDISNAASLLMRLDLDGIPTGNRWEELADLSAARSEDGSLIFADLHYLMALIGDGRDEMATRMVARIRRDGVSPRDEIGRRMADPGLAAARALEAFGNGDYETAFVNFEAARPTMVQAGGSHAQRDVFERMTIDAAIRAGFMLDADRLLCDRDRRRGGHEDGYAAARRDLIARALPVQAVLRRAAV